MLRLRCIVAIAAFMFLFILVVIENAPAGERFRGRHVFYMTKWEQAEVGDEEGHIVAVFERKGIHIDFDKKAFSDGWAIHHAGRIDLNVKTGAGHAQGYDILTDKEGDKVIHRWEGGPGKSGQWEGTVTFIGGTGKWRGIRGTGTWIWHDVTPKQGYGDNVWEVEFP
jgi:hypothetical protein